MHLNFKELKFYCLTIPKNINRINNIKINFNNYNLEFIYSDPTLSKYKSEALGFSRIIDKAIKDQKANNNIFIPFVILEDDVSIYDEIPNNLYIPDNTDMLYIGISDWGYNNSIKWAEKKIFTERIPNFDNIVKIYNMLSQHGIVICSILGAIAFQKSMSEAFITDKYPSDIHTASLQPFYNIYSVLKPLVYQDGMVGGQEEYTKKNLSLDFLNVKIPENYLSKNTFNYISINNI